MGTFEKLLVALVIFALGYTLGQGHKPLDYNGDGRLNAADFREASDKVFKH